MRPPLKGDHIVCPFTHGPQQNLISKSPDGCIAVIAHKQRIEVEPRAPYVCTVQAVNQTPDGTPRSYVLHVDAPLRPSDYDRVVDADFERGTLRLGLRHPTYFRSLRHLDVDAQVEERLLHRPSGEEPLLLLTLRHGSLSRSIKLGQDEAIRRGLRFNHFVPPPPPVEVALQGPPRCPDPRLPVNWSPSLEDRTLHLLDAPASLSRAIRSCLERVDQAELLVMAKRRVASILALQSYEAVPPDSPDDVVLEQALGFILHAASRLVDDVRLRRRLERAMGHQLKRRTTHLPDAEFLRLLTRTGGRWGREADGFSTDLDAFLDLTRDRRSGAWSLANQDLRAGRIILDRHRAQQMLLSCGSRIDGAVAVPADLQVVIGGLVLYAKSVLAEVDRAPVAGAASSQPADLESLPPCVRHALHGALRRGLREPEAYNAHAYLHHAGFDPEAIHRALYGIGVDRDGRFTTTASEGRTEAEPFRPPPCSVNRILGACAWSCSGIRSPLEYGGEHAGRP